MYGQALRKLAAQIFFLVMHSVMRFVPLQQQEGAEVRQVAESGAGETRPSPTDPPTSADTYCSVLWPERTQNQNAR